MQPLCLSLLAPPCSLAPTNLQGDTRDTGPNLRSHAGHECHVVVSQGKCKAHFGLLHLVSASLSSKAYGTQEASRASSRGLFNIIFYQHLYQSMHHGEMERIQPQTLKAGFEGVEVTWVGRKDTSWD